jgi:hypothetical protein
MEIFPKTSKIRGRLWPNPAFSHKTKLPASIADAGSVLLFYVSGEPDCF